MGVPEDAPVQYAAELFLQLLTCFFSSYLDGQRI